jgi:L-lactate utilization protein LutB
MEPEPIQKRDLSARKLLEGGQKKALIPETPTIDEIKHRLREIREYTCKNIGSLVSELQTNLAHYYPQVKVKLAVDDIEAVSYITKISDGIKLLSTNNSSVVNQELKPELLANGFTVINSYLDEFEVRKKEILDYWDLPGLRDKNLWGSFDVSIKMAGLANTESKKYIALLGVNAISAEDGTVFFLQHFSNIHNDLKQANKVVLVVGLDKLVKSRQDAAFQTKGMGMFGMECVLLGIGPKPSKATSIARRAPPPTNRERELYLILLDNGRTGLAKGNFSDLFLCIGCRACNQHCPIRHSFAVDMWTPKNYLRQFMYGEGNSIDVCLHCEACRLECPLDIDLPLLMWQAKKDSRHGRSLSHRLLGMPEMLARLGTTLAPLSNWVMRTKLVRIPMELVTGIDRRANLPRFYSQTFKKWFKKNVEGPS